MDLRPLLAPNDSTIVVVLMDGLGGYADADGGTELEVAATPNLDALAAEGSTGLVEIVGPGITPGSGPGHLALFGYDPVELHFDMATKSIPLDATLIKGSHGAPPQDDDQRGVLLSSMSGAFASETHADVDVCEIVLRQFGI